jgi:dihydroflavonol-4-reductase
MRSLVTGATGLLGNNLVRALLAQGGSVRVLVRPGSDPTPLAGLDVEVVRGDVRDPTSLSAAVAGVEVVYHSAGRVQIGTRNLSELRAVNAAGAANVARACRRAGGRLLHVSSVDALGFGTRESPADESQPRHHVAVPYVMSKREADDLVTHEAELGLDVVFVHPAYLLGPWDWKPSSGRMLLEVARGKALAAPPGGNDFCHVQDVARGVIAAAQQGESGEHFILGGEALSYREAFELFARVTGGTRPRFTAPRPLVMLVGLAGTLWSYPRSPSREPDVNSGSARLSCLPHHFTDRKARERLGYSNRGAEAAAKDAWEWFVKHGYARGFTRS